MNPEAWLAWGRGAGFDALRFFAEMEEAAAGMPSSIQRLDLGDDEEADIRIRIRPKRQGSSLQECSDE